LAGRARAGTADCLIKAACPAEVNLYQPPRPRSLPALPALLRAAWRRDGNLLELLPREVYDIDLGPIGWSRRQTLIVNDPVLVRQIMTTDVDRFPKSDLMVGALEPLVGDSVFVSSGEAWKRQRRMIDPSLSHIRINRAFAAMVAAVDAYEAELDAAASAATPFSLDYAMSHLTADIICRTVFSTSLASRTAREVFDDFVKFERSVAQVRIPRLIFDPAWKTVPQAPEVLEACERIRRHLGELVDGHVADPTGFQDVASDLVTARDPETGTGFDRKELIDQIGVAFLAGHETTASALTWVFFILSALPDVADRMRDEVAAVVGDGPVEFEHVKRLGFLRNVFREALRLYPPITFTPRVSLENTTIGRMKVRRGALVMIAPWVIHRHRRYWRDPDAFDPDRFSSERENELVPGAYLPFGLGPRVCAGASFATTESALILARLVRRYDFEVIDPGSVVPVARLTTRPRDQIRCRVRRR
jgi:cytochrome P450